MPEFFQYVPERIVSHFGSTQLRGFADGSFIKAGYNEDQTTLSSGAQGAITVTVNANRSGRVTLSFQQGSTCNDDFTKACAFYRPRGAPLDVRPFQMKDLNGTTLISGDASWIVKPADSEFAKDAGPREWIIEIADMYMVTGGSVR